jgi:ABC-type Fe3+ transport system permease subunit
MHVRTFAEEVYTQLVGPEGDPARGDPVARAVASALPFVVGLTFLVLAVAQRWQQRLPGRATLAAPPLIYRLGWARWPLAAGAAITVGLLFALPLISLVGKAGWTRGVGWSPFVMYEEMKLIYPKQWLLLGDTLFVAVASGAVSAALALLVCWLALDSGWFRWAVLGLMAAAWAMPGPLVGLGLKLLILRLLNVTEWPLLADLLYYGPSSLPVLWVDVIRFFPCAVAVIWPVLRLMPRELRDAAAVDGASAAGTFFRVVVPLGWVASLRAALAVGVLSLGELSAGKQVSTPACPTYAESVFTQMHYGVTSALAAQCLLLLLAVGVGGLLTLIVWPWSE